jgi:formylglycine-generating enzyme required for sulfatase activity
VAGAVDTLLGLDGAAGVDAALDTALPDGGEVVPTGDAVPDGAQPGDTLTADGAETLDVEAPADADVKHPACYPNCLTPEGYVWVTIPGGSFQMGCTAGDADCNPDELPAHQVTLASFDLLETEVTEAQYLEVMGTNPSGHYNGAAGDDLPVENVTWVAAQAFCEATGGRLPTEAEFEYAARGGQTTRYSCGDDAACLDGIAWYGANSGDQKHAVKTKAANAYGVYDLAGNVWEWCSDWYATYGADAQEDPQGPEAGSDRVYRGGGFAYDAKNQRASFRNAYMPTGDLDYLGFRCARDR